MESTTKRIIGMAVIMAMIVLIVGLMLLGYGKHQRYDELIQVDGEILEKNKGSPNYFFVVKEDDGHIVKFIVDFEEYYTYDVGNYYSGEIRRGNFLEGP